MGGQKLSKIVGHHLCTFPNVKGFVKGFSLCDEFILRLLSHIYDYSLYITLTPAKWGETLSERELVSERKVLSLSCLLSFGLFMIVFFFQKDNIMLRSILSGSSDITGHQCLLFCILFLLGKWRDI